MFGGSLKCMDIKACIERYSGQRFSDLASRTDNAGLPAERHLIADLYQAVKVLKARCGSWGAKPADEEIDEILKRVEAMVTGSTER